MSVKKNVAISAVNFFEGGPLSVLKDCLDYLNTSEFQKEYQFMALVHKEDLFDKNKYLNIDFFEFPKSRKSYLYRLYYEYFFFKNFAKKNEITFWLSLHDMTPNLDGIPQAVYCHNPSPFNTLNFKDIYIQPTQFLFKMFYKFIYQINIKKNRYVIVQQQWIKDSFVKMFGLNRSQVIVSPPQIPQIPIQYLGEIRKNRGNTNTFFFPTFPRPFKNIELICEAVQLIVNRDLDFKVVITIDGTENKYAKTIYDKYKNSKNIEFIGLISREKVYEYYSEVDYLIFPSKLETWGLPLSEFKQFNKPMLVANLPYAKETVGNYEFVNFFDSNDSLQLSKLMVDLIEDKSVFDTSSAMNYEHPYVAGWKELFQLLLK